MKNTAALKLHWVCWLPSTYNDFLFRNLSADPAIDLTVHFIEKTLPIFPWQSQMAQGFASRVYQRRFGVDWHLLNLARRDGQGVFVIGGWHEPTVQWMINLLGARRRPFAIWTDTPDTISKRGWLKSAARGAWLGWVFERAIRVMGTGRPALSALSEMGCSPEKLINLPYFVDLSLFTPVARGSFPAVENAESAEKIRGNSADSSAKSKTIFLASGRLDSRKGFDVAIHALGRVAKELGQDTFVFKIAGAGPEENKLRELARNEGIEENVEFVGWLESDALPSFLRSGDVFLHPARREPYGVSVLEAMASGLAVIASDATCAALDRIEHQKNGLIHRRNDVDHLASLIKYGMAHPEDLADMGAGARRTAEQWPASRAVQIVKTALGGLRE